MQKKQLSVLVLIILCFLLGCNRETPKDESQQNYEDESNISKTNGEELVNINSELLGSTPFDIQIDKTALQTRKETETEVTIKTNLTDWGYTVSSEKGKISDINKNSFIYIAPKDERDDTIKIQSTLQGQVQSLQNENDDLKNQIQILKGTLLNTYSSDEINSVIEQGGLKRDISKRLDNLECLDSVHCEQVPSVKDLYGTTHSVSYRFDASDTAWAKFKLDGQYDTFSANIVTSEDTNRDANMSVEIYLDDVLVGRVDDVVRDEHVRPISVSVNGGNVLMIKVIRTNSYYSSYAYICDTSLSVLQ